MYLHFALPSFRHGLRPNDVISNVRRYESGLALGSARYKEKNRVQQAIIAAKPGCIRTFTGI